MMLPPSSISGAAAPRHGDQGIDADIVSDAESFARGVDEFVFQFVGGGEGDAVHQRVQLAITLFQLGEESVDFSVVGDVAHEGFGAGQG